MTKKAPKRDVNQIAKQVVDILTGTKSKPSKTLPKKKKS